MLLPTEQELDQLVNVFQPGLGYRFRDLPPENKVQVMDLALKACINEALDRIEQDTTEMGKWFKLSKLWEGS